jgi:hypothetical protein
LQRAHQVHAAQFLSSFFLSGFCQCLNFFVRFLLELSVVVIAEHPCLQRAHQVHGAVVAYHLCLKKAEQAHGAVVADHLCLKNAHQAHAVLTAQLTWKQPLAKQSLHSQFTSSTPSSTYLSRNIGCRKHKAILKTAHKVHAGAHRRWRRPS